MSVRKMLKVMMSVLLVVALTATIAHAARLDQSLASNIVAAGKLKDRIPYLLCQRICIGVCVCDRRPVEFAECICSKPGDSKKPDALLHAFEEVLLVKGMLEEHPKKAASVAVQQVPTVKSEIPYEECAEKCKGLCLCGAIWPPPATCMCTELPMLSSVEKLQAKGDTKSSDTGLLPYEECAKSCDICACMPVWPPSSNVCACIQLPMPMKPTAGTGGDDKRMVLWTKAKMEAIPYQECINTCEQCACTLPWPPETAICICLSPKPQAAGFGKALAM